MKKTFRRGYLVNTAVLIAVYALCVALSDLTLLGTISPARILLYALVLAAAYLGGSPAGGHEYRTEGHAVCGPVHG